MAGIIDNLADDMAHREGAGEASTAKWCARQQLLKQADQSPSITHYRELRRSRPEIPPLPHLFLVIDEFGELAFRRGSPKFVDLLLTIGRIGRSIGVHLLLSSQRIEAGRLRGLDTYLSYRIGLRTFSESESAVVLDTPDAFHLPAIPGFGYLKVDTSVYTRFRAGYVSGPVPDLVADVDLPDASPGLSPLPVYDLAVDDPTAEDVAPTPERPSTGRTLVEAAVDRVAQGVARTRPVAAAASSGAHARRLLPSSDGGSPARGDLRVPIGLLDDPAHQRQEPWLLDLTRSGGHVTITGAPQSGRSTFLRSLAASSPSPHPREVSVYRDGPHRRRPVAHRRLPARRRCRHARAPGAAAAAPRGASPPCSRRVRRCSVRTDWTLWPTCAVSTPPAACRSCPPPTSCCSSTAWAACAPTSRRLDGPLSRLLERGGSFGIHVVMTLTRWNELR